MKMLSLIFLAVLLSVATATVPPQAFWAAYRTQMKKDFQNFAFLPHKDEIKLEGLDFVEGGYAKKVATFYSGLHGTTKHNPITDDGLFIFAGVGSTTTQAIEVSYDLKGNGGGKSEGIAESVVTADTLGGSFGAKDPSVDDTKAQALLANLLHRQKVYAETKNVARETVPVIFGKSISDGLNEELTPEFRVGQLIKLVEIDLKWLTDKTPGKPGYALQLLVYAAKALRSRQAAGPSYISEFYLQPKLPSFTHAAKAAPNFGVWFVRNLHLNKAMVQANQNDAQVELPGVNGIGAGKWSPIQAVGDVGGGTTRTIVVWKGDSQGHPGFGKEDGRTANELYEMAQKAGAGNPPSNARADFIAALNKASEIEDKPKKWKAVLSVLATKDYITALNAANNIGDTTKKWEAIGVALAEVIHAEMEFAGIDVGLKLQSKLPIVVLQTGAMRRDYFNPPDALGKGDTLRNGKESIFGKAAAHSAYDDEYYYYGDEDYDYDEYDEGYDDDEYSLYEEAAANMKRAREEFRIAQQLMKWKGRGNSRLLNRYYH